MAHFAAHRETHGMAAYVQVRTPAATSYPRAPEAGVDMCTKRQRLVLRVMFGVGELRT